MYLMIPTRNCVYEANFKSRIDVIMLDNSHAKIFLASQRGCIESSTHRSYHTFNFGSYINKHREPFSNLKTFNDETLAPGASVRYSPVEKTQVIIIPLVGACECMTESITPRIDAGQIFYSDLNAREFIEVRNPFQEELINYLYLELNGGHISTPAVVDFALEEQYNKLQAFKFSTNNFLHLGIYNGRQDGSLTFQESDKQFFVFIVEGAFEVNNRLLHKRDGLALWDSNQLEFEALSNHAIILVIEFI